MVVPAEQHQVRQGGLAAVGPVPDVVGVAPAGRAPAAGEGAAAVAGDQRPPDRWGDQPGGPADVQRFGVRPEQTRLEVVEPQIGDRLLVRDPANGGYAYVNASEVEPSQDG